jgi:hypothetical protein
MDSSQLIFPAAAAEQGPHPHDVLVQRTAMQIGVGSPNASDQLPAVHYAIFPFEQQGEEAEFLGSDGALFTVRKGDGAAGDADAGPANGKGRFPHRLKEWPLEFAAAQKGLDASV